LRVLAEREREREREGKDQFTNESGVTRRASIEQPAIKYIFLHYQAPLPHITTAPSIAL
jgi:hypothetical protein